MSSLKLAWGVGIATVAPNDSVLDVFFRRLGWGESAPKELAEQVQKYLAKNHGSVEVTTYIGGQAWYPLLIGVE